jgi:AcrR family transcriptional regulator
MNPASTETTTPAADRRAARAEARREEILDAAERVFATKGFHETGIADIAAELGIGHGTFYRYFENKQDIAAKVLERAIMGIAAAGYAEDPTASNTIEEYREQTKRIMTGMFELLEQNPQSMRLFHSQSQMIDGTAMHRSFEAYSEFTERFLVNGVEKGFLREDLGTGAGGTDIRRHPARSCRGHPSRDLAALDRRRRRIDVRRRYGLGIAALLELLDRDAIVVRPHHAPADRQHEPKQSERDG